jgi:hypothetical protein
MTDDLPMQQQLSDLPRSRADAREHGVDRYFTGKPCPNGHVAPRYASTGNCFSCQVEHARQYGGWNARPSKEEYLDIVRSLVKSKGGELLSTEYASAKSPLKVRCDQGHEFPTTYDFLRSGRWCPGCKALNQSKRMAAKFRPVEELREFARRRHDGDCLATMPVGVLTKVLWKCRISDHPPFLATPSKVMAPKNGTWCPECDAERRKLHPPKPPIPMDHVEKRVSEKHGRIIAILGDRGWYGGRTRLLLECARGHSWTATATNLLRANSWCPKCQSRFGERITRAILETTFDVEFPLAIPRWMPYGPSGKRRLTLDGYNDDLKLGFEYQGPHHFDDLDVIERDKKKLDACRTHGVRLLVVHGIKKPFPMEHVLKQVASALDAAGIRGTPKLPLYGLFEHELEELRRLANKKRGQCLATVFQGWERARYQWRCENPEHPPWFATRYQIQDLRQWCPHCAGNARLGIDRLREWGLKHGLELLDTTYTNAGSLYNWRCLKARHLFRANKSNIQQSLNKGYPACRECGPGLSVVARARTQLADEFARSLMPVIEKLQSNGFRSLTALAAELNMRKVPTARGKSWYAVSVKNLLARIADIADRRAG